MTILALDTTTEWASLALSHDGSVVAEQTLHSREGFGQLIFGAIQTLLRDASTGIEQIDCFAAAAGPGSFTGVRMGLTVAKGLAEVTGKKVAAVSNLRALASFGKAEHRVVLLDARRSEVFAAVYDAALNAEVMEVVGPLAPWIEALPLQDYDIIVPPTVSFRDQLEVLRLPGTRMLTTPQNLAPAIISCAEIDGAAGKWQDPIAVSANYVRRCDAERLWADRRIGV